jgi:F-type H+-transporting ATPase subunit b
MAKRDAQSRADEAPAERAAVESEQVRRDYDATLAEARAEAARIVDDARQAAEAQRAEILRAAEDEVSARRQATLAELESERSAALGSLRTQVAAIAVEAAGKVVQQQLDVNSNQAIVDSHVSSADGGA